MPLANQVIMMLNEITSNIKNKQELNSQDEIFIKDTFKRILESGQHYNVDEIESWFENEGSWTHRPTIIRVTNMSHYVQSRFEQAPKKLKMVSDNDSCGCD
jgi:hypothetical protein